MKNIVASALSLLLLTAPLAAQPQRRAREQVSMQARFAIADERGLPIGVAIAYTGPLVGGTALAVYTLPDGRQIRDPMVDCVLTTANSTWTIDCRNPHVTTMDGLSHHFAASSPLFTGGDYVWFQIMGDVDVQVVYSGGTSGGPPPKDQR